MRVSLGGCDAMLVRMNVGPTAGAVVYCRRLGQGASSDQFVQKAVHTGGTGTSQN